MKLFESTIGVTLDFGGEIKTLLTSIIGKEFACSCKNIIELTEDSFESYGESEDGYADSDGKKYQIFVNCPVCNYDWALEKIIQNRLPKYSEENGQ